MAIERNLRIKENRNEDKVKTAFRRYTRPLIRWQSILPRQTLGGERYQIETRRMMNRNTRLASLLRLASILMIAGSMVPIQAQDTHTTAHFTDYLDIVIPASDSCSGEDVYIFGPLQGIAQATTDASGGIHSVIHFTPHVTAIGLTSGDTYRAVGPAQIVTNVGGPNETVFALVDIIRVTSPGSVGNLTLTHTVHITVNANGETTVEFNEFSAACRG